MCCRYLFADKEEGFVKSLAHTYGPDVLFRHGEMGPGQLATVLTGRGGICAEDMLWGFPSMTGGQLLINARSETALSKPSFSDSVLRRRCIIVASDFFEWDRSRNKVKFARADEELLFMAGIYKHFEKGDCFTILTTEANASMSGFHDRMPLILGADDIEPWVLDDRESLKLLKAESPMLSHYMEYEQLSLFS